MAPLGTAVAAAASGASGLPSREDHRFEGQGKASDAGACVQDSPLGVRDPKPQPEWRPLRDALLASTLLPTMSWIRGRRRRSGLRD